MTLDPLCVLQAVLTSSGLSQLQALSRSTHTSTAAFLRSCLLCTKLDSSLNVRPSAIHCFQYPLRSALQLSRPPQIASEPSWCRNRCGHWKGTLVLREGRTESPRKKSHRSDTSGQCRPGALSLSCKGAISTKFLLIHQVKCSKSLLLVVLHE